MFRSELVTVKLQGDGRHFSCPYCGRTRQHPPADVHYYIIGYGFCEWCVRWTPIEGGDGLGVARELQGKAPGGGVC